jgi:3-hydroxyacyl-CoA dehydrogenase/enoyl-CoA hydratase/3-hydroxybutyryl-CoA epimerase/enoyl-CoA isomerase
MMRSLYFTKRGVLAKGKPKKEVNPEVYAILGVDATKFNTAVTDSEIVDRLLIPFVFESARCLNEKIVETKEELDLAMLTGLGFPPFRGGPMRFAESIGAAQLIEKGNANFKTLGSLYEVTPGIKEVLSHV